MKARVLLVGAAGCEPALRDLGFQVESVEALWEASELLERAPAAVVVVAAHVADDPQSWAADLLDSRHAPHVIWLGSGAPAGAVAVPDLTRLAETVAAFVPRATVLADDVRALHAEFELRLPSRIAELRSAVDAARSGSAASRVLAAGVAHKLAGTALAYGHAQVGASAKQAERLLNVEPVDWQALVGVLAGLADGAAGAKSN